MKEDEDDWTNDEEVPPDGSNVKELVAMFVLPVNVDAGWYRTDEIDPPDEL